LVSFYKVPLKFQNNFVGEMFWNLSFTITYLQPKTDSPNLHEVFHEVNGVFLGPYILGITVAFLRKYVCWLAREGIPN
jgi:hypothetical protein